MPAMVTIGIVVCLAQLPSVVAQTSEPWKRHIIDASALGADGVRTADVNADGLADLVTSWEESGLTRVYLAGRADSGEPAWRTITVGKSPSAEDAVFFDADGDGVHDVITSTEGDDRKILVHWAPPLRLYTREDEWRTEALHSDGSQWMFAVPMDVDGRRRADIIIGGKNAGASVGWLESPAKPREVKNWRFHRLSDAGWIMSLIVVDMNRDGRDDVLVSDRLGALAGVRWLENPGPNASNLNGPWRNHWIGARGREAMLIDAADLDGDGIREIIVPHYLKDDFRLSIFKIGASSGEWHDHTIRYPALAGRPKAVTVGDVDLDGRPDIVLAAAQAGNGKRGIVWLRFRHSPFQPDWDVFDVSGREGVKFDLNLLVDVDSDGDPDVINSEEIAGLGVVWYENPTRASRPKSGLPN
jgi:hypothetical protein